MSKLRWYVYCRQCGTSIHDSLWNQSKKAYECQVKKHDVYHPLGPGEVNE